MSVKSKLDEFAVQLAPLAVLYPNGVLSMTDATVFVDGTSGRGCMHAKAVLRLLADRGDIHMRTNGRVTYYKFPPSLAEKFPPTAEDVEFTKRAVEGGDWPSCRPMPG